MSLTRTTPASSVLIVPTDVVELPTLPNSIRNLDPEGVSQYEDQMKEYWMRLADSINSINEKLDSQSQ